MRTTFIHPLLAGYLCALAKVDMTREPNSRMAVALTTYLNRKGKPVSPSLTAADFTEPALTAAITKKIETQEAVIVKLLAGQGYGIDMKENAPYFSSKGFSLNSRIDFTDQDIKSIFQEVKEMSFNIPIY